MPSSLFGIHAAALELRSQRIGYKARDIDFATALKAREAGAGSSAAMQYRVPVMPSMDGNTVEMATEQTAFAENAVGYQATLGFIRGRVETLTRALKGE
jgi:flagellar basal-body rod protein FlgB